jgi:hypothetical protein
MRTIDTELDPTGAAPGPTVRHQRVWWIVLAGPVVGASVGVVSRGWMRLITDDPEFSWSGTIFIVLAFTIAGGGHGVAWAVRRAGARRRWSTAARVLAAVLTLPIFTGAGAMMLPTVAGASAASGRRDWPRPVRLVAVVLAAPIPVAVAVGLANDGMTVRRALGAVLLAATYAAIVFSTARAIVAPAADSRALGRATRIALVVASTVVVLLLATFTVGIATAGG